MLRKGSARFALVAVPAIGFTVVHARSAREHGGITDMPAGPPELEGLGRMSLSAVIAFGPNGGENALA